ncbi:sugar transferase [Trichlorobacter ammonificans]|uniref:Bac_transf domain-containing protein n=1 Tax=Trichlorobacter ammonificans TaxID=2916410 RepID=A0ABN8HQR8_9BACT|nr:sugar transferase [Trichlorobacter ammonificans]CAH2032335.1 Bac_transf domain-containing protein [Trichlorobacter ammonificans]
MSAPRQGIASEAVFVEHPLGALLFKRVIDVVVSAAVLTTIWPVLLGAAIAIKLSSPGPILYRGVRSGLHGKEFRILKFRTMVINAEQLGGPTTGTNDPRVTPVGALLRKTKLDELPQFFNVLLGDMSLVGPRPEVLEYTRLYAGEERLILSMRPGITDYASIEFADLDDRVGTVDPDRYFREHILPRKNALRVRYVKEWSLRSDFMLLWSTFLRVVKRVFVR